MNPDNQLQKEQQARVRIDQRLEQAGWVIQNRDAMNLHAGRGVAVREFDMEQGHGFADYLLFVDAKAVGVIEAKHVGYSLGGVTPQAEKYASGVPDWMNPPVSPLPFLYVSTGAVTKFLNLLDAKARTRQVFSFHRPETLVNWLSADTLDAWVKTLHAENKSDITAADDSKPSTLRSRIQTLQQIESNDPWSNVLYDNQKRAINGLERSLKHNRERSLIQMATGSGKTRVAVTSSYRLIKHAGARRVLFLVDRKNLGKQAFTDFMAYRTPDDHRKLESLYNVEHLTSNTIGDSSKVVITTIQRLYSMLKGEPEFEGEDEVTSAFDTDGFDDQGSAREEPLPVVYSQAYPPEYFDVIYIDECHRSIYSLWRQVLDYFDAFLIGLTATPAKHTFGFFNKNLVMEYSHDQAVADNVNVDFDVYTIRTRITADGSTIEAEPQTMLPYFNKETRTERWEKPDEDITYLGKDLDRSVVATDQIRTIIRTFREKLFVDMFPDRADKGSSLTGEVPKTVVFAKDDDHAERIVEVIRDVFGEGDEFCQKITYKTTGDTPENLIQQFRTSHLPRIVVTVDMISTGTDIKPIEILLFMRAVKSRVLWEQMKGRGVRVIKKDELRAVSSRAQAKTHFMIVDCVGMMDSEMNDTQPLERKKSVGFDKLLDHIAKGGTSPEVLSSLASRLARLSKQCGSEEHEIIEDASGGQSLHDMTRALVDSLDPDLQIERAREEFALGDEEEPSEEQVASVAKTMAQQAVEVFATRPRLRQQLQDVKKSLEVLIDEISQDDVIEAGISEQAKLRARGTIESFREFLEENRDEITALQVFYNQPHRQRIRYADLKELAKAIKAPPRSWTPQKLWHAYEVLEKDRVRGASSQRLMTDMVSLVRFALEQDDELVPYADKVRERFAHWMRQQANDGRSFSAAQQEWLQMMCDHIASSVEISANDFDYAPFAEQGGLGAARRDFGSAFGELMEELNRELSA